LGSQKVELRLLEWLDDDPNDRKLIFSKHERNKKGLRYRLLRQAVQWLQSEVAPEHVEERGLAKRLSAQISRFVVTSYFSDAKF